jgi:hypothetical protein
MRERGEMRKIYDSALITHNSSLITIENIDLVKSP